MSTSASAVPANSSDPMVVVSEWLPNPDGKDAGAEWIELANRTADPVDLGGWSIGTGAKHAKISGTVPGRGYLVFRADTLGLSLRNTDGEVDLFDPTGTRVDAASFKGQAPSGLGYSRTGAYFRFVEPTPGAPNPEAAIVKESYPFGLPLHPAVSPWEAVGAALLTGVMMAATVGYIVHSIHDLHDIFFPRHETLGSPLGADAPEIAFED